MLQMHLRFRGDEAEVVRRAIQAGRWRSPEFCRRAVVERALSSIDLDDEPSPEDQTDTAA